MNEKLDIQLNVVDNIAYIDFIGNIDEDVDFSSLLKLPIKSYVFNFDKIEMINSCGIREWIHFLEKIPIQILLVYKNCPQIIIEQMNMVHGFIREGSEIESFYAPFYCENCDQAKMVHLECSCMTERKSPLVDCEKCGSKMEFDAIEEQYFSFLNK